MDEGNEAKTVNRKISSLRSFYRFLQRNELIKSNPMTQIRSPKIPKRLPVVITEQKMDTLLDGGFEFSAGFPGLRDRLIIELLYGTGIRLAELVGLKDEESTKEYYFNIMMERLEKFVEENISNHLVYKKSYCVSDYINDYNSYKGNAYGLANTLMQTAIFKPKIINKKIKNLFYTGQLTVPGPGVPPSIISGKIASNLLDQYILKGNKKMTSKH
jgi:hypothetical protein